MKKEKRDWWTLSLLHATFALLTPLILFWIVGCDGPEEVDYGPEVTGTQINGALSHMIRDSDPTATQEGAYVHFATTDDVSAGEMSLVMTDTFQQVTARNETTSVVSYDLLETKATYHQTDNSASTLTRGFTLAFAKDDSTTQAQMELNAFVHAALSTSNSMKVNINAIARASIKDAPAASPTPEATPDPETVKVTFHRLKTWEDTGIAPAAVLARPNCLGLNNCQLNYRHISFDMVVWNDAKGDPLHFEFTTSPQVPQTIGYQMSPLQNFFPGLMKSCLTQLVPVQSGTQTMKTLIQECQEVQDFMYAGNAK